MAPTKKVARRTRLENAALPPDVEKVSDVSDLPNTDPKSAGAMPHIGA
jgi:hypothetical protein